MSPQYVRFLHFLHRRGINVNYLISLGIGRHAWRLGEPLLRGRHLTA